MKSKVYLRIAKDGSVDAATKYKPEPLRDSRKRAKQTVYLVLNLEIPDEAFAPPNIFASIKVPIERLETAVEVVDPLKVL